MTNPNDAVGTNAAYEGRTSVNAFNDDLASYSRGILSGWACSPNSGLTVSLGGDGSTRDVAVAEDNAGNKTSINNISGSPIDITLAAAPGANSRIDSIVAYVDNPPQGVSTTADNPGACGIISVAGVASNSPVKPDDTAIRTAITSDGASGTTAYYVVLANITITVGTTDIVAGDIEAGDSAYLNTNQIEDGSLTASKLDFTTIDYKTPHTIGVLGGKNVYEVVISFTFSNTADTWQDLTTLDTVPIIGWILSLTGSVYHHDDSVSVIPSTVSDYSFYYDTTNNKMKVRHGSYFNGYSGYLKIQYTTTR